MPQRDADIRLSADDSLATEIPSSLGLCGGSESLPMDTKDVVALSLSGVAIAVSVVSVYLNRRQWRVVNRPFVIARLINPKAGNRGTCYELRVENIGTRPAVAIRLKTDHTALREALDASSTFPPDDIEACFRDSTVIGPLTAGEVIASAFGYNGSEPGERIWKMGSVLPIEIHYRDLQGGKFMTRGSITIATKNGFTGYAWKDT
jgi:hypothetical protein